jgi:hypothetical protein
VAYAVGFGDYADVRWNVKMVNAHLVWDAYFITIGDVTFGYGVTVAVLDVGIDYTPRALRKGDVLYKYRGDEALQRHELGRSAQMGTATARMSPA